MCERDLLEEIQVNPRAYLDMHHGRRLECDQSIPKEPCESYEQENTPFQTPCRRFQCEEIIPQIGYLLRGFVGVPHELTMSLHMYSSIPRHHSGFERGTIP